MIFVSVLMPLWSSYLIRVYTWKLIVADDGPAQLGPATRSGCRASDLAFTNTSLWITLTYVWLPFMILPVFAALERIPNSYLEASGDLGARGGSPFGA